MSEWYTKELGTLLKDKGYIRGPFGFALKRGDMVDEGIPVYEQKNAIYDEREFRFFITPEKFQEMKRFQVKTNDLIISCSGTVGKISIIKEEDPKGIISQALLILRPDVGKITLKFLFYFLTSDHGFNLITQVSHGSVQINIAARKIVETIPVPTPPLPEQKAIAEVLSSFDDKINLLHCQNKTLEQMAETLFRQWFVPARAGEPHAGGEEADEGWEEVTVSEYAEHSKVSIKPSANPLSVYAHFSIPGFDAGKEPVHELGQEIRSNKYQVFENTILFSKLNPHKDKRVWLILDEVPENAICSTEFQVIKPYNESHLYFLYGWLSNSENYREISSGVGGTSGSHQRISPNEIFSFPTPRVSDEVLANYANLVKPIFQKQQNNQTQIRTLEKLRDTLLPKLMSGEIRLNMST